ncbi:MAG: hypothetical protein AAF799_39090 [Myxococcota bacterium]
MHRLAWLFMMVGALSCTRVNGAYNGDPDASSTSSMAGSTGPRTPNASSGPVGSGGQTSGVDGTDTNPPPDTTTGPPPMTTGQTTDAATTTTGIAETGGVGTGPVGDPSPCCVTFGGQGCTADPVVEACVCAMDPFCCKGTWDGLCVEHIQNGKCGHCEDIEPCCLPQETPGCGIDAIDQGCVCSALESAGFEEPDCCGTAWTPACAVLAGALCDIDCPSPLGSCCEATGLLGCEDPDAMFCVCEANPQCCLEGWGDDCVALAIECNNTLCPGVGGVE